jgi:diadenosine tetraphosphatase ApaH/serine/threonine PP2A family protein phosphatase
VLLPLSLVVFLIECPRVGRVCLNRGNHEDFAVCCVYGFQMECRDKYDNVTFGMFVEIFQNLPLATVLDGTVLVVHGGLFHCLDASLRDLEAVSRQTFTLSDTHTDGVSVESVPRYQRAEFLRQLQRDALWSDPNPNPGLHLNPRGESLYL